MTAMLFRSFPTVLERTDRRTLDGLFVPWDAPADVVDYEPTAEGLVAHRYREGFRSGAFDRQASSVEPGVVRRIVLRDQHRDGIGKLGHVVALRNGPDGLHGTVSILPSRVDDLDALVEDGVSGLSAEFHPLGRPEIGTDGTVWRTKAHLIGVALEAQPAYPDARVLALRAAEEVEDEERIASEAGRRELDDLDAWLSSARDSGRRWVP
jgi:HK97 family phage prohead protease